MFDNNGIIENQTNNLPQVHSSNIEQQFDQNGNLYYVVYPESNVFHHPYYSVLKKAKILCFPPSITAHQRNTKKSPIGPVKTPFPSRPSILNTLGLFVWWFFCPVKQFYEHNNTSKM